MSRPQVVHRFLVIVLVLVVVLVRANGVAPNSWIGKHVCYEYRQLPGLRSHLRDNKPAVLSTFSTPDRAEQVMGNWSIGVLRQVRIVIRVRGVGSAFRARLLIGETQG